MKKKVGCLLSILLAVALLVGGWLAFRALAIYMFEGLFRVETVQLEELTEEQTKLLAEHFKLTPEELGDVTGYRCINSPRDNYVIFFAQADSDSIHRLAAGLGEEYRVMNMENELTQSREFDVPDGTCIAYDEKITLRGVAGCEFEIRSGYRTIYRLRDGTGYLFYTFLPPPISVSSRRGDCRAKCAVCPDHDPIPQKKHTRSRERGCVCFFAQVYAISMFSSP